MKMKEKFGKICFPGWLFAALMVVYNELMLHTWITEEFHAGRLVAVIAFAMGFGLVLALISSLFSQKVSKYVAIVLALVVTVFWMTEYFVADTYRVFMTPATVIGGAGGVAQDYADLVVGLIVAEVGRIFMMLLPTILYGIFCQSTKTGWKIRGILAVAAVICYALGILFVRNLTPDANKLGKAYNFDNAVHSFGMK